MRVDTTAGRSVLAIGWNTLRKRWLKDHPFCAACGYEPGRFERLIRNNDVHHIEPRHANPTRATDWNNLITLCRKYNCHLRVGHFGHYRKRWNPRIAELLADIGLKIAGAEAWFRFEEQDHDA